MCVYVYTLECICVRLHVHVNVPVHATAKNVYKQLQRQDPYVFVSVLFLLL